MINLLHVPNKVGQYINLLTCCMLNICLETFIECVFYDYFIFKNSFSVELHCKCDLSFIGIKSQGSHRNMLC